MKNWFRGVLLTLALAAGALGVAGTANASVPPEPGCVYGGTQSNVSGGATHNFSNTLVTQTKCSIVDAWMFEPANGDSGSVHLQALVSGTWVTIASKTMSVGSATHIHFATGFALGHPTSIRFIFPSSSFTSVQVEY